MVRICSIDPGVTTGYVLGKYSPEHNTYDIIESGEVAGIAGARYLTSLPSHLWVVEDFSLIPHKAQQVALNDPKLMTVQIIGALKMVVPAGLIYMQMPSEKQGCPDSELQAAGLWQPNDSKHIRDAIRHMIVFTRRRLNARVYRRLEQAGISI